jgi:hypothetical protein
MMQFEIYHVTNPKFKDAPIQDRKHVGSVTADTLEEAFVLSQNFMNPWNKDQPCRSTSVGDVIERAGVKYVVCGNGFKQI